MRRIRERSKRNNQFLDERRTMQSKIFLTIFFSLLFTHASHAELYTYTYQNMLKEDGAKVHYMNYEKDGENVKISKCSSRKKCLHGADYDPFLWEIYSPEMKRRIGYFGRDGQYAKEHIFLPKKIAVGEKETERASGQGTGGLLYGIFSTEVTKVEGDLVFVKHRFSHNNGGHWDRDVVLKKNQDNSYLIQSDELKVYRTDEGGKLRSHTQWNLKQ